MKSYVIAAAGVILVASAYAGFQALGPAGAGNDNGLQMRTQSDEVVSEIDAANAGAAASDVQSQAMPVETISSSTSELFLEQVFINSKNQAAESAYHLSLLAANRNDYAVARALIEESIQLNQSNPNYLTLAADLAFLAQDYDKAAAYQLRVLEIARSVVKVDDLQVALILDQLGAVYVMQKDYAKAESSFTESLQLREKTLGDSHLQVASSLNKLASLAARQNQSDVAEALFKRSLNIVRDVSGSRHGNSATMLAILADFYQDEARLEEAEALYKEALSIWSDSSADPLSQAACQDSLGQLFLSQQRFDDARLQFEQELALLKKNYAQDHPYVQQAINNLARLDAEQERSVEKDAMYDELVRELSVLSPKRM